MGFYGNIVNNAKSTFSFDITYPNRATMDSFVASGLDDVYVGRYALIEYDSDPEKAAVASSKTVYTAIRIDYYDEDGTFSQSSYLRYAGAATGVSDTEYVGGIINRLAGKNYTSRDNLKTDLEKSLGTILKIGASATGGVLNGDLISCIYKIDVQHAENNDSTTGIWVPLMAYTGTVLYKCTGSRDDGTAIFTHLVSPITGAYRFGSLSDGIMYKDGKDYKHFTFVPTFQASSLGSGEVTLGSIVQVAYISTLAYTAFEALADNEKPKISNLAQEGKAYEYWTCIGSDTYKHAIFEPIQMNASSNYDNYSMNYSIDAAKYHSGRGYDSTVWQKVSEGGKMKYVMIAELNAVVPTLSISVDAPTQVPVPPHFDVESNSAYYKLHVQPTWGMRIASASLDSAHSALTDDEDKTSVEVGAPLTFPSDLRGDYVPFNALNYDGTSHTINAKESKISNEPLAVYFNKDGFNPDRGATSTDYINHNFPNKHLYYDQSISLKDETGKTVKGGKRLDNAIRITPTGKSNNLYNKHDGTLSKASLPDTYELKIMLPGLGDAVSSMWDAVYGPNTYYDNEGHRLYDSNFRIALTPEDTTDDEQTWFGGLRNTDMRWNSKAGRRLYKTETTPGLDRRFYNYDVESLNSIAGVVNSLHDLMGMNIVQYAGYLNGTLVKQDDKYTGKIDVNDVTVTELDSNGDPSLHSQINSVSQLSPDKIYYFRANQQATNSILAQNKEAQKEMQAYNVQINDAITQITALENEVTALTKELQQNSVGYTSYSEELANYHNLMRTLISQHYSKSSDVDALLNKIESGDKRKPITNTLDKDHLEKDYIAANFGVDPLDKADPSNSVSALDISHAENLNAYSISWWAAKAGIEPYQSVKTKTEAAINADKAKIAQYQATAKTAQQKLDKLSLQDIPMESIGKFYRKAHVQEIEALGDATYASKRYGLAGTKNGELKKFDPSVYYRLEVTDLPKPVTDSSTGETSYLAYNYLLDREGPKDGYPYVTLNAGNIKAVDTSYEPNKFYFEPADVSIVDGGGNTYNKTNSRIFQIDTHATPSPHTYYSLKYTAAGIEGTDGVVNQETKYEVYVPNKYYYENDGNYLLDIAPSRTFAGGTQYYKITEKQGESSSSGSSDGRVVKVIDSNGNVSYIKYVDNSTTISKDNQVNLIDLYDNIHGNLWFIYEDRNTGVKYLCQETAEGVKSATGLQRAATHQYLWIYQDTEEIKDENGNVTKTENLYINDSNDEKHRLKSVNNFYTVKNNFYYLENGSWYQEWREAVANEAKHPDHIINYFSAPVVTGYYTGEDFYDPNKKYYVKSNDQYVLATSYDPNATYYEEYPLCVAEDANKIYDTGALWNPLAETKVPSGVKLGVAKNKWRLQEIEGYADRGTNINSLILHTEHKLATNNELTRDLETAQGGINSLRDIVHRISDLNPTQLLAVDEYGRVHSTTWNSRQADTITNLGTGASSSEAAVDKHWVDLSLDGKFSAPNITIKHATAHTKANTTTSADLNNTSSGNGLNNGKTNSIDLYTPIVDAAGHVVGKNTETVTLPYGFKTISTNGSSTTADDDLSGDATASVVADNTQDTLALNTYNKWIQVATNAGVDEIDFAHKLSTFTPTASSADFNNAGTTTFKIPTYSYDGAGHITGLDTKTLTMANDFKTVHISNNGTAGSDLVAANPIDAFSITTGDTWTNITSDASKKTISLTHNGPSATKTYSAGQTSNTTPAFGSTFVVMSASADERGHINGMASHTVTIPEPSLSTASSDQIVTGISLTPTTGAFTYTKANVGTFALTGYSLPTDGSADITAKDTLNTALGKLQYQTNALESLVGSTSVSTQISNAIGALEAAGATAGNTQILNSVSETNGKISASAATLGDKQIASGETTRTLTTMLGNIISLEGLVGTTGVSTQISNAIGNLDADAVTATDYQVINSVSETNGKISATASSISSKTVTDGTNTATLAEMLTELKNLIDEIVKIEKATGIGSYSQ